jgi:ribosomal protein L37AE/L43A
MYSTHGRLAPADQNELAGLRGKKMKCPDCGLVVVTKVEFAETKCDKCGAQLQDLDYAQAKVTGRVAE